MSEAVIEVKGRSTSAKSLLLDSSENSRGDFYDLIQVSRLKSRGSVIARVSETEDYFKIWGGKLRSRLNSLTLARGRTSQLSVIC
jgi:hypothetical protein